MQGQKAGLKARIENEKKRRRKQNEMNKSDHLSLLVNNHGNSMSHHKRYSDFLAGVEAIASIQKEKSARSRLVENRNRISADPEEEFSRNHIINPNCMRKIQWDLFVGSIIVYSIIVIPFRIGFQIQLDYAGNISEYIIDLIFLTDMILNFFTAYIDPITDKMVLDHKKICFQYLKMWFWIDFFSTVPFDSLLSFATTHSDKFSTVRLIRIFRLARIIKLARFMKLSRLTGHMERLSMSPALLNVIKLVVQIFFIAHLISCFWFYLTTSDVTGVTEVPSTSPEYPLLRTWATEFGLQYMSTFDQYVASFYWTLATMLSVGYGDIHATNDDERLYSIFTMLSGGIMFGAVIAQVTRLIETRNPQARAFKEKMDEIKAYLGEKNIPSHLKAKAKDAYIYYLQRKSSFGENGIFESLPRPLFINLVKNIYDREFRHIKLFQTLDPAFVADIVMNCNPLQALRGQTIFNEGDIADEVIFVLRGSLELFYMKGSTKVLIGSCLEGGYIGDMEITKKTTRLTTCVAATNCNLISISRQYLLEAMDANNDHCDLFREELQQRYLNLKLVMSADNFRLDDTMGYSCKSYVWVDGILHTPSQLLSSDDSLYVDLLYRVVVSADDGQTQMLLEVSMDDILKYYIIHPRMTWKIYWDSFVGVLILYSVLIIPVQIGFSLTSNSDLEHVIDSIFFVDILLTSRTAYFADDEDVWMLIPSAIFKNYAKTWFAIDLLSCIPFETLMSAFFQATVTGLSSLKLLKVTRLARLLKLVRLIKFSKYINHLEDLLGISPSAFDLLKMILEVFFIGHLIACVWWGLSSLLTVETWYDNLTMVYEPLASAAVSTQYIVSLYWTFTTLTTVGYGDITPVNSSERIVNCVIMMIGATVFGYIVANVSALMGTLNQSEVRANEKLAEVTEYLNEKNCPKGLATAIIRHYKHMFSQVTVFDEEGILMRLPRLLSVEVELFQYEEIMKRIPLFRYISNNTVCLFIYKLLQSEFFDTGQFIFENGDPSNEIRFIVSGHVSICLFRNDIKKRSRKDKKDDSKRLKSIRSASSAVDRSDVATENVENSETNTNVDTNLDSDDDSDDSSSVSSVTTINASSSKSPSNKRKRKNKPNMVGKSLKANIPSNSKRAFLIAANYKKSTRIVGSNLTSLSERSSANDLDLNGNKSETEVEGENAGEEGKTDFVCLGELTSGDIIGHVPFLSQSRHKAYARADIPCSVFALKRSTISMLLKNFPAVGYLLQCALGEVIYDQNFDIGRHFVRSNRARFLTRLKDQHLALKNTKKISEPSSIPVLHPRRLLSAMKSKFMNFTGQDTNNDSLPILRKPAPLQSRSAKYQIVPISENKEDMDENENSTRTKSSIAPSPKASISRTSPSPKASRWNVVRSVINDAKVTATIATMSVNAPIIDPDIGSYDIQFSDMNVGMDKTVDNNSNSSETGSLNRDPSINFDITFSNSVAVDSNSILCEGDHREEASSLESTPLIGRPTTLSDTQLCVCVDRNDESHKVDDKNEGGNNKDEGDSSDCHKDDCHKEEYHMEENSMKDSSPACDNTATTLLNDIHSSAQDGGTELSVISKPQVSCENVIEMKLDQDFEIADSKNTTNLDIENSNEPVRDTNNHDQTPSSDVAAPRTGISSNVISELDSLIKRKRSVLGTVATSVVSAVHNSAAFARPQFRHRLSLFSKALKSRVGSEIDKILDQSHIEYDSDDESMMNEIGYRQFVKRKVDFSMDIGQPLSTMPSLKLDIDGPLLKEHSESSSGDVVFVKKSKSFSDLLDLTKRISVDPKIRKQKRSNIALRRRVYSYPSFDLMEWKRRRIDRSLI